jgi:hypothetical protein
MAMRFTHRNFHTPKGGFMRQKRYSIPSREHGDVRQWREDLFQFFYHELIRLGLAQEKKDIFVWCFGRLVCAYEQRFVRLFPAVHGGNHPLLESENNYVYDVGFFDTTVNNHEKRLESLPGILFFADGTAQYRTSLTDPKTVKVQYKSWRTAIRAFYRILDRIIGKIEREARNARKRISNRSQLNGLPYQRTRRNH